MSEKIPMERHNYDVLVIGAGGAGLRAAVEAREAGLRVAIICKSLFGKAHTVMAEGGIAASMGNVNDKDGWQVHFRDTMRGGKFLNHYRMAELHAKEAPDRVWELEMWGALFEHGENTWLSPEGIHEQWLTLVRYADSAKQLRSALIAAGAATSAEAAQLLTRHQNQLLEVIAQKWQNQPKLAAAAAALSSSQNQPVAA